MKSHSLCLYIFFFFFWWFWADIIFTMMMTFIWHWPKIPLLVLMKSVWSWLLSLVFMTFDFYLKSFLVDGDKLTFALSVSPCLVDLYWPVWPWVLFFVCTGPELSDGAVPDPPTVGDLPDLRRDPAAIWEHPGDRDLPAAVPDQPGGGHPAGGGLLPDRGPQGLQGRLMSLLPWWCTLFLGGENCFSCNWRVVCDELKTLALY